MTTYKEIVEAVRKEIEILKESSIKYSPEQIIKKISWIVGEDLK